MYSTLLEFSEGVTSKLILFTRLFFFGFLCCLANLSYAANNTQINRYTTIANQPTAAQVNPLLAVVQYKFQPSIRTVGDAINAILQNTSYQLVPSDKLSKVVAENLQKPLPITVRTLGPIEIKDALIVLMGKDVFILVADPLHRLVDFKVKPNMAKALGVKHAN
jgi:conjugative transfer region protein (TIGR03748 family)